MEMIAQTPTPAMPAPRSPPIRAWLLDTGIPRREVARTQSTAPTIAMRISAGVRNDGSTIPLPIVAAIAVVKRRGPRRLKTPARSTACRGVKALVAMMVAIAFAASFKPFEKLKRRARRMPRMMIGSMAVRSV
jgi:hypothetical protein